MCNTSKKSSGKLSFNSEIIFEVFFQKKNKKMTFSFFRYGSRGLPSPYQDNIVYGWPLSLHSRSPIDSFHPYAVAAAKDNGHMMRASWKYIQNNGTDWLKKLWGYSQLNYQHTYCHSVHLVHGFPFINHYFNKRLRF